ncbi:hypothetical protein FJZ36_18020 [Candidatus Poribacteria bacterium]|nr:hypothetical protein [Candidatus Poribacteria bacterium]
MSAPSRDNRLTPRAVLTGLLGAALLSVATPVSDFLLNGTWLAACHLPIGVVCVFVALRFAVAPFLARTGKPFSHGEWVVLYAMMLVSAGFSSLGFAAYVVPILAAIPYYATPENDWFAVFSQHLPSWMAPFDERASRSFFEGGDAPVPWALWLRPLAIWTIYALILFWGMLCICVLLRRQWIERERLAFPLVQLPLELLEPIGGRRRGLVLLLGAGVPFLIHAINGLHVYFPSVPGIPLFFDVGAHLNEKPWDIMRPLWVILHFSAVGFVFLLPVDLSFSLWLFYFLFHMQSVAMVVMGLPLGQSTGYATRGFAAYQMAGGILMLAAAAIWRVRTSLGEHFSTAWRGKDDGSEPLSPRGAIVGLGLTFLAVVIAGGIAGIPLWLSFATTLLFLVTMIAMTRMVSESGLLFIQTPFRPTDLLTPVLGTSPMTPRGLAVLNVQEMIFSFDVRSSAMPSVMDAFKLLDTSPLRRRSLVTPMLGASVLAMVVSCATVLLIGQANGAASVSGWFGIGAPQLPFNRLTAQLVNGTSSDLYSVFWMGVGGTLVATLGVLRARFLWFPLHPIGYAMGPSWPMIQLWFSTLLGWAAKSVALRFGGLRTFLRWRPFFLGMVLGEFLAGGFWVVVDFALGKQGHRIFLF